MNQCGKKAKCALLKQKTIEGAFKTRTECHIGERERISPCGKTFSTKFGLF